jgi:predicted ribosome-associated RNA-binding protein Tma20
MRDGAREKIRNGGIPAARDLVGWKEDFRTGDHIFVADEQGDIMAIGKSKFDAEDVRSNKTNDFFSYVRVLI